MGEQRLDVRKIAVSIALGWTVLCYKAAMGHVRHLL
jgi:hypothetical protein